MVRRAAITWFRLQLKRRVACLLTVGELDEDAQRRTISLSGPGGIVFSWEPKTPLEIESFKLIGESLCLR